MARQDFEDRLKRMDASAVQHGPGTRSGPPAPRASRGGFLFGIVSGALGSAIGIGTGVAAGYLLSALVIGFQSRGEEQPIPDGIENVAIFAAMPVALIGVFWLAARAFRRNGRRSAFFENARFASIAMTILILGALVLSAIMGWGGAGSEASGG